MTERDSYNQDITNTSSESDAQNELMLAAERITSVLPFTDGSQPKARELFAGFLQAMTDQESAAAMAIVEHKESYRRPSLDVFVIFSHPIDLLNDEDQIDMDSLTDEHVKFNQSLELLSPSFNTHLNILDPRHHTIEKLAESFEEMPEDMIPQRVLDARTLSRPSIIESTIKVDKDSEENVVTIELETCLEDIPEGPPCPTCGNPTKKIILEHTTRGEDIKVVAENAAGYICEDCDVSFLSSEALVESLTVSREVMIKNNDGKTADIFEKIIEKQQGHLNPRISQDQKRVIPIPTQEEI